MSERSKGVGSTSEPRNLAATSISPIARDEEQSLFSNLPSRVNIYEVGPRDGLQNEKAILSAEQKISLIESLVDAGVPRIEITSFVNPRWIPALADHAEVAKGVKRKPGVIYSALVPNLRGLDAACLSGMQEVAIFMAVSNTHNLKNINKSTVEALATYKEVVGEALARNLRVRAYLSCVYGCPYEGRIDRQNVIDVGRALLDLGVYELSLGDTIGVGTPRQVGHVLSGLLGAGIGREQLAVHFHDTRGTALANVLVALELGIPTIDTAIGGLGGCPYAPGASGNVATEDVVYMLSGMGVECGVDLDKLVPITVRLAAELAHELPSKYSKAHVAHCARVGSVL
jgi:hydroxymethylglutaryl-CoA lyase